MPVGIGIGGLCSISNGTPPRPHAAIQIRMSFVNTGIQNCYDSGTIDRKHSRGLRIIPGGLIKCPLIAGIEQWISNSCRVEFYRQRGIFDIALGF